MGKPDRSGRAAPSEPANGETGERQNEKCKTGEGVVALSRLASVDVRLMEQMDYGLQTNVVPTFCGSVHSGPRFVVVQRGPGSPGSKE